MEHSYLRQPNVIGGGITDAGMELLESIVTNTTGNVYSFNSQFNPKIIAAAMARLSRYGGDMRELILKEFSVETGQEELLLRRVLTQFGDDSVQQLGMVPVVVENASNLVAKQIEWGRLAAYLEQSTRYIYYDAKRDGRYRYFIPPEFPQALRRTYCLAMDTVFANYSQLVRKMTEHYQQASNVAGAERDAAWRIAMRGKACDASRGLLPLATTSTIGIVASAQAVDSMIMHLLAQDLPEAQAIGRQILEEVRKTQSIFFERTDMPQRGGATVDYRRRTRQRLSQLADRLIAAGPARTRQLASVRLLEYTPRREFDLLAHMLFPYVSLSFGGLRKILGGWSDAERESLFALYMGERGNRRHRPGRALEVGHYTFELVSDYACFKDLQRHRIVDGLEWQAPGTALGYDMPEAVAAAGHADLYRRTVAAADQLYAVIAAAGFALQAPYAVLHTHKLRWKLTMNAREAFHFIELRTQPAGYFGYRKLCQQMYDEIAKAHPNLAKAMIFVNRNDDDPSSSRLQQARAAQAKLKALGLDDLIE